MIVDRIDGEHFIYLKSLQSYEKKNAYLISTLSIFIYLLFLFIKREKKKELKTQILKA